MTEFNKIMYGVAFGAMICALVTSLIVLFTYGRYVEDEAIDQLLRNLLLGDTLIAGIAFLLTRYKSSDR